MPSRKAEVDASPTPNEPSVSFFSKPGAVSSEQAAEGSRAIRPSPTPTVKPEIADLTEIQRERALEIWRDDAVAVQYCKALLQTYAANSKATRVVLGPQGEVKERDVKSNRSLNTLWKSTIAIADAEILLPIRENPENHWVVLNRPKYHPGSTDKGPVAQISNWIYQGGADEMELSTALERE
ncbi:hypothetical protein ACHAO4_005949 [Trichoderma viride]